MLAVGIDICRIQTGIKGCLTGGSHYPTGCPHVANRQTLAVSSTCTWTVPAYAMVDE